MISRSIANSKAEVSPSSLAHSCGRRCYSPPVLLQGRKNEAQKPAASSAAMSDTYNEHPYIYIYIYIWLYTVPSVCSITRDRKFHSEENVQSDVSEISCGVLDLKSSSRFPGDQMSFTILRQVYKCRGAYEPAYLYINDICEAEQVYSLTSQPHTNIYFDRFVKLPTKRRSPEVCLVPKLVSKIDEANFTMIGTLNQRDPRRCEPSNDRTKIYEHSVKTFLRRLVFFFPQWY